MSWADILILFVLGCFTVYGLLEGLTVQLAGLGGVVGGLALAILLLEPVSRFIRYRLGDLPGLTGIVFAGILFLVWLCANLWGLVRRERNRRRSDSWTEDIGGALVGLANGIMVIAVSIAAFGSQNVRFAQVLRASRLGSLTLALSERAWATLSHWIEVLTP